jgi:hypothetical protein
MTFLDGGRAGQITSKYLTRKYFSRAEPGAMSPIVARSAVGVNQGEWAAAPATLVS